MFISRAVALECTASQSNKLILFFKSKLLINKMLMHMQFYCSRGEYGNFNHFLDISASHLNGEVY